MKIYNIVMVNVENYRLIRWYLNMKGFFFFYLKERKRCFLKELLDSTKI